MRDCQGLKGCSRDFSGSSDRKQSACNVGAAAAAKSLQSCPPLCNSRDGSPSGSPIPGILPGSISGLGRCPVEGNGNPLQYSCLEKSHGWKCQADYSHRVAKSGTRLSDFTLEGCWGAEWLLVSNRLLWGGDESVPGLLVMIVQLSEYSKNHWTVHFKGVNFMICEVYLQISI